MKKIILAMMVFISSYSFAEEYVIDRVVWVNANELKEVYEVLKKNQCFTDIEVIHQGRPLYINDFRIEYKMHIVLE